MSFSALQPTVGLSVTNVSQAAPIQLPSAQSGTPSARITNSSTMVSVFVSFGNSSASAAAAAVIPTPGHPQACIHLLPMGTLIVVVPPDSTHVGFIGSVAGPALAYVTIGADGF